MPKGLLCITLFMMLYGSAPAQKTYYVKNGGNDNADGLSDATAFASLTKVNALRLSPGERVLFKRGSTFIGGLFWDNVNAGTASARVVVGAYGTGSKPVISRRQSVPGWSNAAAWTNTSGHFWRFTIGTLCRRLWNGTREFAQRFDTVPASAIDYGNPTAGMTADYQYCTRNNGDIIVYCSNDKPWSFYTDPIYSGPQTLDDSWGYSCVDLREVHYATIRDLQFEGGEFTAMYIWDSDYLIVDSCDFVRTNQSFRAAYGADHGEMVRCRFLAMDTIVHDYEAPASNADRRKHNTDHATLYRSSYWKVHDCLFVGASHDAINCHGVGTGATDRSVYNEIYNNEITGGGVDYSRAYETLATTASYGVCSYNTFHHNYIHGTTEWSQFMGDHNAMYYNVIDTVKRSWKPEGYQAGGVNIGGFEMAAYNTFANNLVMNCEGAGIVHVYGGTGSERNAILNNIVVNCGTDLGYHKGMQYAGIVIDVSGGPVTVRNNLCYSPFTDAPYIYHQNYYSVQPVTRLRADQLNGTRSSGDSISGNLSGLPRVNTDYSIASDSPARDAGILLGYSSDFFGNPVPTSTQGKVDIGACELQVDQSPSAAPILLVPSATVPAVPLVFKARWRAIAGATRYHLQITDDPSFQHTVVNDTTVTDTSKEVLLSLNDANYYCRIRAYTGARWGTFSTVIPFSTDDNLKTGVEGSGNNVPGSYDLYPAYPNPFNPSTTIRFDLPLAGRVLLRIFSITGQEVRVLLDENREAGSHRVVLDARGLSSGMYFCRLQSGSFAATTKLVLTK
jgi:hypothetical protein